MHIYISLRPEARVAWMEGGVVIREIFFLNVSQRTEKHRPERQKGEGQTDRQRHREKERSRERQRDRETKRVKYESKNRKTET